uniref:Translationally-controlled tumor protein homolog n=1 Tax=Globodera pallida TaxID=36090 RepID=A0A183BZV5_GLOPA
MFFVIFHKSNTLSPHFKVFVRLMVYERETDIFWDYNKGTLHADSVPNLIRTGVIETHADQTAREVVDKAVNKFYKQLLEDDDGDDKFYKIVAIFEDKELNMQIQREMGAEPNAEYTAILLGNNGKKMWHL